MGLTTSRDEGREQNDVAQIGALEAVPEFEVEVVENSNRTSCIQEVSPTTPMIPKDAPAFEASDCVLDTRSSFAMPLPTVIANDTAATKARCHEMMLTSVATVCQYATVVATKHFDGGTAVVNWIVAITRSTARDREDAQVSPHEHLKIA